MQRMRIRHVLRRRCAALAAVLATVLAVTAGACSPSPFDAAAPWTPGQPGTGRGFDESFGAGAPDLGFALFEREVPPPQESVTRPGDDAASQQKARDEASPPPVVQMCYGRLFNDPDAVRTAARDLCPAAHTRLELIGQDRVWNDCPLFQPARAAFRCLPSK